ncbi:MAG: S8 family serine peptidase [Bacteroidetes bacterium]|nr:S8 family serine peptidase [Bacteroidota bacterium]
MVSGGSSFAAPVVAGIGALFLEKNPQLTAAQFRQYIICAAKTDTSTGLALPDNTWGYGKVNGFNTLLMCGVGINENIAANYFVTVFPNPFSNFTQIKIGGLSENDFMQLQIMDVTGRY